MRKIEKQKIIAKNHMFHAPLREVPLVVWWTLRAHLGEYFKHHSVIKPLLDIFSFSQGIFHVIRLDYHEN